MTPGGTRGPTGLLGSAKGAGSGRTGKGRDAQAGSTGQESPGLLRRPRDATALAMRPLASTDAGTETRADPGRALSPTASVMKATWMKSESQLSTYMNHMAPPPRPPRPPPDRRDGPARLGSGDTEPPPPSPRPRPADGGTAVRRAREQPGRSAAPRPNTDERRPPARRTSRRGPRTAPCSGHPGLHPGKGPRRSPGAGTRRLPEGQRSGHPLGAPAPAWRGPGRERAA